MSHYQPLAGVKVLDLTAVIMGPFGTQILADMGAEVTVVETPVGDANRHMGKGPHPDVSGVTLNLMRNKRSIVLDLRSDEGRAIFEKLVAESDVSSPTFVRALVSVLVLLPTIYGRFALILSGLPQLATTRVHQMPMPLHTTTSFRQQPDSLTPMSVQGFHR